MTSLLALIALVATDDAGRISHRYAGDLTWTPVQGLSSWWGGGSVPAEGASRKEPWSCAAVFAILLHRFLRAVPNFSCGPTVGEPRAPKWDTCPSGALHASVESSCRRRANGRVMTTRIIRNERTANMASVNPPDTWGGR